MRDHPKDAQRTMGTIILVIVIGIPGCPHYTSLSSCSVRRDDNIGYLRRRQVLQNPPGGGLAAQLASAIVILGAFLVGGPVSTTQVVSSGIMGVGVADRLNKVR